MKTLVFCLMLVLSVACVRTPEAAREPVSPSNTTTDPSRELVLELINKKIAPKQVFAHMNTSSRVLKDFTPIYKQMIDDKLIKCGWSESCLCWVNCRPTEERLYELRVEQEEQGAVTGSLWMEMGWKEVKEVTGISKVNESVAMAEYLVVYAPPDSSAPEYAIFKKYEAAFRLDNTNSETHRAYLRKFDNGWRIERLE